MEPQKKREALEGELLPRRGYVPQPPPGKLPTFAELERDLSGSSALGPLFADFDRIFGGGK